LEKYLIDLTSQKKKRKFSDTGKRLMLSSSKSNAVKVRSLILSMTVHLLQLDFLITVTLLQVPLRTS
jgi:hypothetical protein